VFLAHIDEIFAAKLQIKSKPMWYSKLALKTDKSYVYSKSFDELLFSTKKLSLLPLKIDSKNVVRENTVSIVESSIILSSVIILVH
jgi:hypothetical protein